MTRQSTDPDKVKFEQDVADQVKAFFATGGKMYQATEGETALGKIPQAFTIHPSRKKEK